jgi:hypothetical protein
MSASAVSAVKFPLGRLVATPNALSRLTQDDILAGVARHQAGDWGDMVPDDRNENDQALAKGRRLLSVYHARNCIKFWIITEADRNSTTVLLPEDY